MDRLGVNGPWATSEGARVRAQLAWGMERWSSVHEVVRAVNHAVAVRRGVVAPVLCDLQRADRIEVLLRRLVPTIRLLKREIDDWVPVTTAASPSRKRKDSHGDLVELSEHVAALCSAADNAHSYARALEPAVHLALKRTPSVSSLPDYVRPALVRAVFRGNASFSRSPSQWAYFAIGEGIDQPCATAGEFRRRNVDLWKKTLRTVRGNRPQEK